MRNSVLLLLLVGLVQLPGCVSYERCQAKFGTSAQGVKVPLRLQAPGDSFTVRLRPYALPLPGDTLEFHSGRARLKVYQDTARKAPAPTLSTPPSEWDYWAFEVGCDTVVLTDTVSCPPQTVFACPDPSAHAGDSPLRTIWRGWGKLSAWVLPLVLALWLLIRPVRRRFAPILHL